MIKKIYMLSHSCPDGLSSQVLVGNFYKDVYYRNSTYGKIKDELYFLKEELQNNKDFNTVIISDLCFDVYDYELLEDIAEEFSERNFYYLDHHEYEYDLETPVKNLHIYHTHAKCGTKITAGFLENVLKNPLSEELKHYVEVIDTYDRRQDESPLYEEAEFFIKFFSLENYKFKYNRIRDRLIKSVLLTQEETTEINNEIKRQKNIFDNLKSRFRNSLFSFAYSDEYVIDLQQKYEDSLIYLNVLSFHRGSIRINKTVPDEIAEIIRESFIETYENLKEVQTIGGHARAIGITFDKQFSMEDVNKIIIEETGKLLKELKDKIQ